MKREMETYRLERHLREAEWHTHMHSAHAAKHTRHHTVHAVHAIKHVQLLLLLILLLLLLLRLLLLLLLLGLLLLEELLLLVGRGRLLSTLCTKLLLLLLGEELLVRGGGSSGIRTGWDHSESRRELTTRTKIVRVSQQGAGLEAIQAVHAIVQAVQPRYTEAIEPIKPVHAIDIHAVEAHAHAHADTVQHGRSSDGAVERSGRVERGRGGLRAACARTSASLRTDGGRTAGRSGLVVRLLLIIRACERPRRVE